MRDFFEATEWRKLGGRVITQFVTTDHSYQLLTTINYTASCSRFFVSSPLSPTHSAK